MFFYNIKKRLLFLVFFLILFTIIIFFVFKEIFYSNYILIDFAIHPFNICEKYPDLWNFIKITYIISYYLSILIIFNFIYYIVFYKKNVINKSTFSSNNINAFVSDLNLLVGKDLNNNLLYINDKGLYQNILITGTIGSGKTSSAMYPFTKQLINFKSDNKNEKIGILILDVKGNYHKQVSNYCKLYNREKDLIILSLDGSIFYNPLNKPNLKPHILANRLKTILTLFSSQNSESYWLDKAERQ